MHGLIKQKLTPYKIHIIASILIGGNAVAIKLAIREIDPILLASLKFIGVGLIVGYFYRGRLAGINRQAFKVIIISSVLVMISASALFVGIEHTAALKAGIIRLVTPMVLYVIAILFLKEKFIKRALMGSIVGLAGSTLVIGLPLLQAGTFNKGDLLLLLSAVFLAVNLALTKYAFKYANIAQLLSSRLLIAGLLMLSYVLLTGRTFGLASAGAITYLSTIYLIFIGGALGLLMFYHSLRKLRAEETAPVFYLIPLTTVISASALLGESLSYIDYIGASIIVFGVMLAHPHHHHMLHRFHLPEEDKLHKILNFLKRNLSYIHSHIRL